MAGILPAKCGDPLVIKRRKIPEPWIRSQEFPMYWVEYNPYNSKIILSNWSFHHTNEATQLATNDYQRIYKHVCIHLDASNVAIVWKSESKMEVYSWENWIIYKYIYIYVYVYKYKTSTIWIKAPQFSRPAEAIKVLVALNVFSLGWAPSAHTSGQCYRSTGLESWAQELSWVCSLYKNI